MISSSGPTRQIAEFVNPAALMRDAWIDGESLGGLCTDRLLGNQDHHSPHDVGTQSTEERFTDQQQDLVCSTLQAREAHGQEGPLPCPSHPYAEHVQTRPEIPFIVAVSGIGPLRTPFILRARSLASMDNRPKKSCQLCRVCCVRSPQDCSRTTTWKCCHCSVHGASHIMGVSLLRWNGFAFENNAACSRHSQRMVYTGERLWRACVAQGSFGTRCHE